MELIIKPIPIIDYADDPSYKQQVNPQPPEISGYELDTIEKARIWLTNPHNWFKSKLFVLKWDGLVPTINEEHGRRLIEEPHDDGLPWCVVYGQAQRRAKNARGESVDEPEVQLADE